MSEPLKPELERAIDAAETPSDIRVFDPMRLCDGIEPSGDPLLELKPVGSGRCAES